MATTVISVEDYLRTTSEPDCEYVRGVLKQRSSAEWDHSSWQAALIQWFSQHNKDWEIRVLPSIRIQAAADQFRVPDVTLVSRQAPREQFLTHAPLAVLEILSPGDSIPELFDKLEAYEAMGIPAIWVIDPENATYRRFLQGKLVEDTLFELPGTRFSVPITEIAAQVE